MVKLIKIIITFLKSLFKKKEKPGFIQPVEPPQNEEVRKINKHVWDIRKRTRDYWKRMKAGKRAGKEKRKRYPQRYLLKEI